VEITTDPSPTAEATRLTDPARTSPTALSVAAIKVLDEQGPFFRAAGSPFHHCLIISPGQRCLSRAQHLDL
jgi:hypothetical protein